MYEHPGIQLHQVVPPVSRGNTTLQNMHEEGAANPFSVC